MPRPSARRARRRAPRGTARRSSVVAALRTADGETDRAGGFFFSSRRRHTRCLSDWSSDVCSSDLAFEHVWRLHTPEYEITEAGARQVEGEFDPRLCERYAGVKGARVGRGFSKRVISELGGSPGAQEHLLTAIEMARVGQQVYQYTPEFEAQFPSGGGGATEDARITWLKDRAYMGLANTCYTYRDESESLFASREVRCGFGAELTRPKPGDRRVFWRNKRLAIELKARGNGETIY